jgi:hypothetical protein
MIQNKIVVIEQPVQIVQLKHLGLQGPPGGGSTKFVHEERVLTLAEAIANKIILEQEADEDNMILMLISGAPTQRRSVDYEYYPEDNSISWAGLGLNDFLEEGEELEILYAPKNS